MKSIKVLSFFLIFFLGLDSDSFAQSVVEQKIDSVYNLLASKHDSLMVIGFQAYSENTYRLISVGWDEDSVSVYASYFYSNRRDFDSILKCRMSRMEIREEEFFYRHWQESVAGAKGIDGRRVDIFLKPYKGNLTTSILTKDIDFFFENLMKVVLREGVCRYGWKYDVLISGFDHLNFLPPIVRAAAKLDNSSERRFEFLTRTNSHKESPCSNAGAFHFHGLAAPISRR
ncbi:MAG: hypothetical protein RIB86_22705 [Imperialibacter sp.]